jgi:hypothetical protein
MTELRQKMIRAMELNCAASYRLGYKPSTVRWPPFIVRKPLQMPVLQPRDQMALSARFKS